MSDNIVHFLSVQRNKSIFYDDFYGVMPSRERLSKTAVSQLDIEPLISIYVCHRDLPLALTQFCREYDPMALRTVLRKFWEFECAPLQGPVRVTGVPDRLIIDRRLFGELDNAFFVWLDRHHIAYDFSDRKDARFRTKVQLQHRYPDPMLIDRGKSCVLTLEQLNQGTWNDLKYAFAGQPVSRAQQDLITRYYTQSRPRLDDFTDVYDSEYRPESKSLNAYTSNDKTASIAIWYYGYKEMRAQISVAHAGYIDLIDDETQINFNLEHEVLYKAGMISNVSESRDDEVFTEQPMAFLTPPPAENTGANIVFYHLFNLRFQRFFADFDQTLAVQLLHALYGGADAELVRRVCHEVDIDPESELTDHSEAGAPLSIAERYLDILGTERPRIQINVIPDELDIGQGVEYLTRYFSDLRDEKAPLYLVEVGMHDLYIFNGDCLRIFFVPFGISNELYKNTESVQESVTEVISCIDELDSDVPLVWQLFALEFENCQQGLEPFNMGNDIEDLILKWWERFEQGSVTVVPAFDEESEPLTTKAE